MEKVVLVDQHERPTYHMPERQKAGRAMLRQSTKLPAPSSKALTGDQLLWHPLVLKAAWRRVRSWYEMGEWAPTFELLDWDLDPTAKLVELGEELAANAYKPSPFRIVPYPKKGGIIRHYTRPSVKDQVAFAAFGVLLAPALEMQMPNFSFGNRWYRSTYRSYPESRQKEQASEQLALFTSGSQDPRESRQPRWLRRHFSLGDRLLYQPYPRSHGLFRRVAHWTATAMLRVDVTDTAATDNPKRRDDYERGSLPQFIEKEWWRLDQEVANGDPPPNLLRGHWAHLDLQLAYPTLSLNYLAKVLPAYAAAHANDGDHLLLELFGAKFDIRQSLAGYPEPIAAVLADPATRRALAQRLVRHLFEIEYEPLRYEQDETAEKFLWLPPHQNHTLPLDDDGKHRCIPTGLSIAGLLMNTALLSMDARMAAWMRDARDSNRPTAFLRFADDMLLFASSVADLTAGIDELWNGLCHYPSSSIHGASVLSTPSGSYPATNLRLNWAKIEPPPLAQLVYLYLKDQGWETCPSCQQPIPPATTPLTEPKQLADWCRDLSQTETLGLRDRESLRLCYQKISATFADHTIRPDRLSPFLTYLVERLSAIGRDTLSVRFGTDAHHRLVQLHELVRFDLQDGQVKEDTRLAFAVSRLAKAWLPETDLTEDRLQIRQIRRSIQISVSKAPWKFGLWRAVVQGAVRRPPGRSDDTDQQEANEWLLHMLGAIAFGKEEVLRHRLDEEDTLAWSEELNSRGCWDSSNRSDNTVSFDSLLLALARRNLSLSYLRTAFWRSLAGVLHDLTAVTEQLSWVAGRTFEWRSSHWTFRSFAEDDLPAIVAWLSDLDRWSEALYPAHRQKEIQGYLADWWWESEALEMAIAACRSLPSLLRHLRPQDLVELRVAPNEMVSTSFVLADRLDNSPFKETATLLVHAAPHKASNAWLFALLARREPTHDEPLAALIADPKIFGMGWSTLAKTTSLLARLNVAHALPLSYLASLRRIQQDSPGWWWDSSGSYMRKVHRLEIYGRIRHLLLSVPQASLEQATQDLDIYRLLWGNCSRIDNGRRRRKDFGPTPEPTSPAIGLPIRVALSMFLDVVQEMRTLKTPPREVLSYPRPFVWLILQRARKLLETGRALQLGRGSWPAGPHASRPRPWIKSSAEQVNWSIPPHPAFFLPVAMGLIEHTNDISFQLWCAALIFYTAVDGSERILDALFSRGPSVVPLSERWDLRSRISLDVCVWECLDQITRSIGFGVASDKAMADLSDLIEKLEHSLKTTLGRNPASVYDFRWERVDVKLDLTRSLEIPLAVSPFFSHAKTRVDDRLRIQKDSLAESISVRIGQVQAAPDWRHFLKRFPCLKRKEIQDIMAEVWSTLSAEGRGTSGESHKASLVVLPELTIPRSEIPSIVQASREKDVGIFCGLMWRVIPTVGTPHRSARQGRRFFVNEGLLAVPLRPADDDGPPLVRRFFVEKPIPAPAERGWAKALSASFKGLTDSEWEITPGRKWYRFLHPTWGDFSVAICSDLLDASPWTSLRGSILHLFMCAYNSDVELYEALTWVRAYENYVNIVSVNHGQPGGSFAWSPRHGGKKELAKLRGGNLLMTADVSLPVRSLFVEQRTGGTKAVEIEAKKLFKLEDDPEDDAVKSFKTPPPEYPARAE